MTLREDGRVLLCSGCAAEAGADSDVNSVPPQSDGPSTACEHCGATIVGFSYLVPEASYSGMAPGAG